MLWLTHREKMPNDSFTCLERSPTMLGRFLFGGAGVLALLCVTAIPGPLQAQHGRGGSRAMGSPAMRSPNFGRPMGGFDRRVFTPGFGRTMGGFDRRIFTPGSSINGFNSRFGRFDRDFDRRFDRGFGSFDRDFDRGFGRFDRDFDRSFDRRFFDTRFGFTPGTMRFSPGFFGTPGFGGFTPGFFGSLGLGGFSPGLG